MSDEDFERMKRDVQAANIRREKAKAKGITSLGNPTWEVEEAKPSRRIPKESVTKKVEAPVPVQVLKEEAAAKPKRESSSRAPKKEEVEVAKPVKKERAPKKN